jgi:hypothetical protein
MVAQRSLWQWNMSDKIKAGKDSEHLKWKDVSDIGVRSHPVRQWVVKMQLDAQKQELVPPKKLERKCRKDIISDL